MCNCASLGCGHDLPLQLLWSLTMLVTAGAAGWLLCPAPALQAVVRSTHKGSGGGGRHHQARHSAGFGVSGAFAGVLSCPAPCQSARAPYLLLTWPAAAAPSPPGAHSRCWTGPCQTCPGSCRWWLHSACSGSRTCMRMHAPVTVLLCCLHTGVHMQNCYKDWQSACTLHPTHSGVPLPSSASAACTQAGCFFTSLLP